MNVRSYLSLVVLTQKFGHNVAMTESKITTFVLRSAQFDRLLFSVNNLFASMIPKDRGTMCGTPFMGMSEW